VIEWAKNPEEFTFKPQILGDHRAGKAMPLFSEFRTQQKNKLNPK
jgi:hypothetical protein